MSERAGAGGRGLLTLLRAAAIVIIATGLNDVIAGAVPSYEPLYVYLGAVALVAMLDGIAASAITAVLAVAFYALLFMPRAEALSPRIGVPAGLALATAVLVSTGRGLLRRGSGKTAEPEAVRSAAPPMLAPPQILTLDSSEILLAIDSLRSDLRGAVAEAAAARDREATARDREAMLERSYAQAREALSGRLHVAEEETKRLLEAIADERVRRSQAELALAERKADVERLTIAERESAEALQLARDEGARQLAATRNELAAARNEAVELKTRVGVLESAMRAAESVRRNAAALQHELETARAEATAHAAEATARTGEVQTLRAGFEELRRALEIEKGRSEGERGIRTTAVERVTELERALRIEREAREREHEALRVRLQETEQTNAELQRAAASASSSSGRVRELEQLLEEERQTRAAVQAELVRAQRSVKEAESARGSRETELLLVRRSLAELETAAGQERAEHVRALTEVERELAAADEEIAAKGAELDTRRQVEVELRVRLEELEALRDTDRQSGEARLAALSSQLEQDREMDRLRFAEEREAMRREREEERREFDTKLATLAAHLAEDHETDLGKVVEEREEARAELRAAKAQLESLRAAVAGAHATLETERNALGARLDDAVATLEREREERAAERMESDAKLSTIAAHLAEDHEADLGRIVEEREAARAELRSANLRIASLQQALETALARPTVDEDVTDRLRARIAELEASLEEERAGSAAAAAEFDAQLTTIVAHLASDHEADLGKALEEKEAAKAEARSLSMRIAALQKKFEDDHSSLVARVRDAEERQQHAIDDSTRILAETRAAAQNEIERLQRRIVELEGQTLSAVKPPSAPMPDPAVITPAKPPSTPTAPLILVAHADAEMRMSARVSLERAGYEVLGAADGFEALRTATAIQPDVVIADAVLPKMGGRELCQLLKSQERTANIRVVLLTRAVDAPPKGEFPPDEVLNKPVPLESLKATLAGLLASRA